MTHLHYLVLAQVLKYTAMLSHKMDINYFLPSSEVIAPIDFLWVLNTLETYPGFLVTRNSLAIALNRNYVPMVVAHIERIQ